MEEEIDKKKANRTLYIAMAVIILIAVGLVTNGFGLFGGTSTPSTSVLLSIGNSPVLGDPNAPVTIYEFSDFSCPFCAAADGKNSVYISQLKAKDPTWQAPVPNIIENYVKTGKAKLVFKYYPGHGTGQAAHIVAWNLNDQGLFWKFHDVAFANQEDTGNLDKMLVIAKDLGANMTQLQEGIDSHKYDSQFSNDEKMGFANKVGGTPTFFVNKERVEGATSYLDFKKIIDKEL